MSSIGSGLTSFGLGVYVFRQTGNQSAAQEVMAEFTRLNQEGSTILMVTHDSKVAAKCGRILYLLGGCIKGEFSPAGIAGEKEREAAVSRWLAGMGW